MNRIHQINSKHIAKTIALKRAKRRILAKQRAGAARTILVAPWIVPNSAVRKLEEVMPNTSRRVALLSEKP